MGTSWESNHVNIFMEYVAGGTIESLLNSFGPFDETIIRNFTGQIVKGVVYIHSKNIVHR
jgi:mitogen-activated protein kinase kinase kinase